MYQNQLSEEVITDYIFRQRLYNSMHPKLRQQAELIYDEDDTFKQLIKDVERIDAVLRDTGVYKDEKRDYPSNSSKPKDRHKSKGKTAKGYKKQDRDDRKAGPTCYSCGGKGHMSKECPSKKDDKKGKGKMIKKEARSNNVEYEQDSMHEVYIHATEIESYATAQTTRPANIKPHGSLEGMIHLNGKEAKVLFDTGTIGANIVSAHIVTTHGIPCTEMAKPTKIHMAMKGSRSESQKECSVEISVGKMKVPNTKMIIGNLAKYDALIGMPFLMQHQASIDCHKLTLEFPKHRVRVNCMPTSEYVRAAVLSTEKIMDQHANGFPESIPGGLPPLRKINHRIRLKPSVEVRTLPTYSVPEQHMAALSEWIREKERQGVIRGQAVHGAAPMFVQYKKDGKRARPLVGLTERNKITLKDDEPIPNQTTILNDMARARYRSKIDLSDAYFQTRVEPEDVWKNSFKSPFGGFVSEVMLQGDMNAPGTFMRIMSDLMADFLGKFVWVYIDDLLIFSNTEEDHLEHIAAICNKLEGAQFYASRKKSEFFAPRIEVLGRIIDDEGLKADPERIAKIEAWSTPTTKRQLQEFLGVVNYISKFLPHIPTLTAPVTALTGTAEFVWTAVMGAPYREVNSKVATAPKLQVEDKDRVNNSRRIKMVKFNIVKLKASLNKFSGGKLIIEVECQTLKLK